jgi:hypothetical protein
MSGNSIAISRELVSAGLEEKTASAVAEAIVKHSYSNEIGIENKLHNLENRFQSLEIQFAEHRAESRAEFKAVRAEIKSEAKKNDMRFNIVIGLLVALCAGIFVIIMQMPFGG